ncbi:hypothetical protein Tco_0954799 [Tanacetum coccineum]|uniref:Uncharacterized protein n=1 Tax=Tanacetum coccineum TaxID=301880 RepID=A0ABQ5E5E2_9ASTR
MFIRYNTFVIRDTLGVSVSKSKALAKVDRGKGMDILSDAALLEAAQVKEAFKKSKKDSHMLHASSSGDEVGSQPKVSDESEDKTTGTDEGTINKPGVPDVPKYQSDSENESWGDIEDDDSNHDDNDDVSKHDDDDDADSDANGEEETQDDEYVHTPDYYVPTDEETNDENKEFDEEEYDELYKDVNVRSKVVEHEEVGKRDAEMTDVSHESVSQKSYMSKSLMMHIKFLILDNVPPSDNEITSLMNVKVHHEESITQALFLLSVPVMAIPETSTVPATTVSSTIQPFTLIPQQSTPTPKPTTKPTITSILALLDFSSLFGFCKIPTIVDEHLSTRIRFATQTALQSYTAEFEKKTQEETDRYIDLVEKSIKDIIKDELKNQLPHILPKEVSDFATPIIQSAINESLKNVVLDNSSSQLKSTYKAAASLTEFELKKILLDKMQKSKSYRAAPEHKELYDGLVKSYKLDKDLFESYGKTYSLKKDREDKDKDEDPLAGSDQSSSKGTKSQLKSSGKSVQAEEPVFEVADTEMSQDQGGDLGNTEDQTNVKAAPKHDWFKKPKRPLTPHPAWNDGKSIDFRPPQTWISIIAQAEKPPHSFNKLMSTPIDFSSYVMHNLKIDNLTQEILVRHAFNLLKGTCKSFVELEYHFEECYKAVTDRLDWNNPEGQEYPFDLSKPLLLIEDRGRQVILVNYSINNDLDYLKGGSSSRKYTTSTTKTKAAKCDNIKGIEDMVLTL